MNCVVADTLGSSALANLTFANEPSEAKYYIINPHVKHLSTPNTVAHLEFI